MPREALTFTSEPPSLPPQRGSLDNLPQIPWRFIDYRCLPLRKGIIIQHQKHIIKLKNRQVKYQLRTWNPFKSLPLLCSLHLPLLFSTLHLLPPSLPTTPKERELPTWVTDDTRSGFLIYENIIREFPLLFWSPGHYDWGLFLFSHDIFFNWLFENFTSYIPLLSQSFHIHYPATSPQKKIENKN